MTISSQSWRIVSHYFDIASDPETFDPALLPPHVLNAVEADSFWCLSRLLDGIQDNYIFAQPGIQRSVRRMAELVARIDGMSRCGCAREFLLMTLTMLLYSSSLSSSGRPERRVYAVRLPVDELSSDA